jgi:hypothetical protein
MESIIVPNLNLGSFNVGNGFVYGEMLRAMLGFTDGDASSIAIGVKIGAIPAPDWDGAPGTPQNWMWQSTTVASLIATQSEINSVQSAVAAWRAKNPSVT